MKKLILTIAVLIIISPTLTYAAGISFSQAESILMVLRAFGVEEQVVLNVKAILEPVSIEGGTSTTTVTTGTSQQNWTVTATPVQPIQVGGIIPSMQDLSDLVVSQVGYINDPTEEFGIYKFEVSVLNTEGSKIKTNVVMAAPDQKAVWANQYSTVSTNSRTNLVAPFGYFPTSKGEKTITFSANGLTKTITINVQ